MSKTLSNHAARALCLAALLSVPARSHACGFDGLLGYGLSALHPRSIQVAFAIRDAVDDGLTPASVLAPIAPGSAGYWRAVGHLRNFQKLLAATAHGQAETPSISILFIDSNLWTRFHSADGRIEAAVHMIGAGTGDVEIITSEAILAELLAKRMPVATALGRGLVELRGGDVARVERWLRAAFDPSNEDLIALQADRGGFPLFGKSSRAQK